MGRERRKEMQRRCLAGQEHKLRERRGKSERNKNAHQADVNWAGGGEEMEGGRDNEKDRDEGGRAGRSGRERGGDGTGRERRRTVGGNGAKGRGWKRDALQDGWTDEGRQMEYKMRTFSALALPSVR